MALVTLPGAGQGSGICTIGVEKEWNNCLHYTDWDLFGDLVIVML